MARRPPLSHALIAALAAPWMACKADVPPVPNKPLPSAVPSPAESAAAPPSASASTPPPSDTSASDNDAGIRGRATFYCFSWVHLDQSSTDCYRSQAECAASKKRMHEGARDTMECDSKVGAACTRVKRPEQTTDPGDERCFGNLGACGRYRRFVARNGLSTSDCEER